MAAFNLTAQINLRGPSNVKKVVSGIQKQLSGLNANINLNISKGAVKTLADANVKLQQINTSLNKVSTSAAKANSAVAQFARTINSIGTGNVSVKIQNASNATKQLGNNAKTSFKNIKIARTEIEEFGRQSALAVRRFTAFASVTSVIYGVNNAINQALSDFIKFDRQLVRLTQVTGQTASGLKGIQSTIGELSTSFGVSSSSLAEVSVTLAQAGFSIREVQSALKALALTDVSPTFDNLNQTVEGSIALLRQFSINASQLEASLGSINAVAAAFAVESSDIIAAVQRAGGVFAAASKGVSNGTDALNEFVAVFTSVRATTRESAETISTGLRTIFTRLQRETTIDALKEFGVNLQDAEGKFVGAYRAVQLLSEGLGTLDPRDIRFSKIVEELGGFRQIGKVIPLISQFATAQEALKVAQQGQDSLATSAAQAQAALAVQFAKVREEFLKLVRDIAGTESFRGLISGALSLTSVLIKLADSVKGIVPILGLLAAAKGASAIAQFAKGFGGGLRKATPFARGGTVPGSGNTDSVPAMLTPGEFVLRKSAVRSIGTERLHKMNKYGSGEKVKMTGKQLSQTYGSLGSITDPQRTYEATVQKRTVPTEDILSIMQNKKKRAPNLPNWLVFEEALSQKYNLGKPARGNKFLDFPDSRPPAEAKFLRWGGTYGSDPETGFVRGNNKETLLAKLVGSGKYKQGWRNVVSYYPESLSQIQKGLQKLLFGGLIQRFAAGGIAKQPLVDDITQTTNSILPRPGDAISKLIAAGGGFVDIDNTLLRTIGDKAYNRARTKGQQTAALDTYFRDASTRLTDITSAPLTQFGKELLSAIKSGQLNPSKLSVVSKSMRVPGIAEYINSLFGIPIANMAFTQGGGKQPFVDKTSATGKTRSERIQRFAAGGLAKDQAGFESIRQQILDKYQNINFRITKRKAGFGYNILAGLKGDGLSSASYSVFEQAKNLTDLTAKADKVASQILYEYGPDIDPSLLKKLRNKPSAKFALGGSTQDTVPAMLTPGEFVVNRESAKRIGYGNLRKMNTRPQGFNKGGIVGFANGGLSSARGGDISFGSVATGQIQQLEQAFISLGLPADQLTGIITANGKASRQAYIGFVKQSKANIQLAQSSAKSSVELQKVQMLEKQLTSIRQTAIRQKTGGTTGQAANFVQSNAFTNLILAAGGAAVALEAFNTPLTSAGAALLTSLTSLTTTVLAAIPAIQSLANSGTGKAVGGFLGKIPGLGQLGGLLTKLAGPIGIAITAFTAISAVVSAYNAYIKKSIDLEKEKATKKLDTANTNATKAMEKFAKDASLINFGAVNRAIADQISAGQDFAAARGRQTQFEQQAGATGTGAFVRELGAYLTLGYIDSIEDVTRNNEGRVKQAAKDIVQANSEAFKNAQQAATIAFEKGATLSDIKGGTTPELAQLKNNLIETALAADQAYQEQVQLAAAQGKTLSAAVVAANKKRVESDLFAANGALALKDKVEQAARAQEALGRLQARLATSFERLNNVVQQSIGRVQLESAARQGAIDGLVAIASGEARIAEIQSTSANVIENPMAYTERERASARSTIAANLTPGLGRQQATEVAALATFDPAVIEKSFTDVANNVAVAAKPSEVGEQIRENLALEIDKLRAAGAEDTARSLQEQANATATIIASKLEGVSDPTQRQNIIDQALEELEQKFNSVRDQAVQTAKAFEEFRTGALNQFSRNLAEVAKLQNQALKYEQAAIDATRNATDSINEALSGFGPSIAELTRRQAEDTARLTGGPTDPAGIANNLTALGAASQLLNQQIQDAANAGDLNAVETLTTRLNEVNRELNNNRQALEQLAESAGRAAEAALAEVNERKRLQDANRAFAETLLSSGPDELKKLDESLVRANQRLNGFIPQAGASQRKRFFELLKQTGSVRQASQGVAAETRAEDLKFLRETRDVRTMQLQDQFVQQGLDPQEARRRADELINRQESQILSQMGQEAGLGRLGQGIVGRAAATTADRRNDPTMVAAIDAYQQATQVQIEANQQLRNLTDALASQLLVDSQAKLRESIDNLNATMSGAEQRSGPAGAPRDAQAPARRQKGGLIYAAGGQYVNFEPKGTDTVPAMLTPGEFVVNRKATQQNMGLLQAINGGKINTYAKGGKVAYLASGGFAQRDTNKDGVITVGVEDASGLNDTNKDGVITFAEFMTNQSLNDPKARDYINKISQSIINGKNVSPLKLLSNEQFLDEANLFGPINAEYADYVKGQYKKDLESFNNLNKQKAEIDSEINKLTKNGQQEPEWLTPESDKLEQLRQQQNQIEKDLGGLDNRNFNMARRGMNGTNFNEVFQRRQQLIDRYSQQGLPIDQATQKADESIQQGMGFDDAQMGIFNRMVDRRETMQNIRGTGGSLSTVRSAHQAGISAARSDYIRTRNKLIKEGMNPLEASITAQQSASDTYYNARNNFFERRANRIKQRPGFREKPGQAKQEQAMIEGGVIPVLPEVAGVIPSVAQLNAQVADAGQMAQDINRDNDQQQQQQQARDLKAEQDAARDIEAQENARIAKLEKERLEREQRANQERAQAERDAWVASQNAALDAKIKAKEKELEDAKQIENEAYGGWFGAVRNFVIGTYIPGFGRGAQSGLSTEVADKEKEIARLRRAKEATTQYAAGQIDINQYGSGAEGLVSFVEGQSGLTSGMRAPGMTRYDRAGVRTTAENAEFMATEEQGINATRAVVETGIQAVGALATLGASTATTAPTLVRSVVTAAGSSGATEGAVAIAEGDSAAQVAYRTGRAAAVGAAGAGLGYAAGQGIGAARRFVRGRGPRLPAGGRPTSSLPDTVDPLRASDAFDPAGAQAALNDFEAGLVSSQTTTAAANTPIPRSTPRSAVGAGAAVDPNANLTISRRPATTATTGTTTTRSTQGAVPAVDADANLIPEDIPDWFRGGDAERFINEPLPTLNYTAPRPVAAPRTRARTSNTTLANRAIARDLAAAQNASQSPVRAVSEAIAGGILAGAGVLGAYSLLPIDEEALWQSVSDYSSSRNPSVPDAKPVPLPPGFPGTTIPTKKEKKNNRPSAQMMSQGGIVYANNGALIPYRSMGTDTVPAMLTPGEFVVNRQSTSQHLPLLRAINSGYNKHSMMTNYLAKGGVAGAPQYLQQGGITRGAANNGVSVNSQIEGLEEFKAVVAQLNEAMSGGTENMNNVVNQISQASVAFSATAQSVQAAAINIPESVNVAQNVRVDGIPDTLNDFSNNLLNSSVAQSTQQTSKQFSDLNTKNEGSLGLPSPNNNQFIT